MTEVFPRQVVTFLDEQPDVGESAFDLRGVSDK